MQASTTLAPAHKQAQSKGVRQASSKQVMAVLTPDQKAKLVRLGRQRRNG